MIHRAYYCMHAHSRCGRAPWRRWFVPLTALGLLLLGPALAHSQEAGTDSLTLRWTAVGDDSLTGTASLYDLRMSGAAITAANWAAATAVGGLPAPAPSGSAQSVVVRGLTTGETYYFALRVRDDAGNWSGVSNLVRWDGTLDESPPPVPSGLTAGLSGDGVHLSWSPSGAADLAGYSVYRATAQAGPYSKLNVDLITATEYQDDALPADAASTWYRVTASDMSGNESAQSAAVPGLETSASLALLWRVSPGYPNPSHGDESVTIPVVLEAAGTARLDVVDVAGHLVRRLDLRGLGAGYQEIAWDGRNDAGRLVAPGAYRCWLVAGDVRLSARLVRVP